MNKEPSKKETVYVDGSHRHSVDPTRVDDDLLKQEDQDLLRWWEKALCFFSHLPIK